MKKVLFLVCVVTLLAGCSSAPKIKYVDVSVPELNAASTAYLGETLLMQARGYYTDVVELGNITGSYVAINAGKYCRLPGSDEYFSFDGRSIRFINFLGGSRGYTSRLTYEEDSNKICIDDMWSGCFDSSYGTINFKKNILCSDPNSFQQIIEYNGKAGDILNFTYREFSGDRVNAPYTTNFTMDTSEGDTLRYKGAQLKVDKATNQQIVYRVLRNFNKAE